MKTISSIRITVTENEWHSTFIHFYNRICHQQQSKYHSYQHAIKAGKNRVKAIQTNI